jgi:hypothetical protein
MISTFRLPDLVLGVRIQADVTGTRQAARDLKNAVGRELGTGGGTTGGGGGGFGGGLLGGLLGAGMMGGRGSTGGGVTAPVKARIKSMAREIAATVTSGTSSIVAAVSTKHRQYRSGRTKKDKKYNTALLPGEMLFDTIMREEGWKTNPLGKRPTNPVIVNRKLANYVRKKYAMSKDWTTVGAMDFLRQHNISHVGGLASSMGTFSNTTGSSAATINMMAAGAGLGSTARGLGRGLRGSVARGVGVGGMGRGGLMQRGLRAAGLGSIGRLAGMARFGVVGAILAALLASIWAFVKSLKAAVAYIRQSIVNDKVFRPFVNQLDEFGRMWTNLWRQTGLMLITVLPLTEALAAFTNVLKIWGTVIAGITPFLKTMASLNFNFTVLRFIADLYSKLPGGSGGISLPMGSKMAPGALEGSVEAYRSIYGGADYLAKIAENTFDMKQALRNFGTGFVIGVVGG